ncbi:winged helix-turn-helix transcriptional regulator [Methermicoccus shengliensis]|uniref:Winged helix-turn-helix transcriptional regulator n=1 Tax=Methermicoccus shengliensis TaxID=660064 RepID=A0A832RXU7_9EURY|nr:winged helix-turn-helix transcriptional regulator [Methermicoccus shengliensis]KUK04148.1 MAG: Helix-turn-helix, type 11 domain protein [Euryarchaeota archaeon 55_53]KUK29738.1 MAG: Helix-turn-helix, type 11 domain protein [Methanosarcinales archeaon 56_1174]MDI3487794.1 putative transcriptional regulator [Methanosarcinales archaeon]MDN5294849.1 putative transcriptional regulator [Methanosarcinales archaeon]HIH69869.1 winged helix-turn-helix transcriptional regulator [Methermicoccus shengli
MVEILQSKKESTKFQILVEIAANQPNVRQREIAEKIGVTPQAVSEYIKELVEEGLVLTDGRVRYSVTKEGVEWIQESAYALKRYALHVIEDVISHAAVWSALAETDLSKGEKVSLYMRDGLLIAKPYDEGIPASGEAFSDAKAGEDVGVTSLKGMIELTVKPVVVCRVPRVEHGGSRRIDLERLRTMAERADFVCVMGVEALVSLRKVGVEPDVMFGAKEAAVEAAYHGEAVLVVALTNEVPTLLTKLESEGLKYELVDILVE